MGQQVKGYRRNAVYGTETRRRGGRKGCIEEVNPPGKDGWKKSGVERNAKGYGESEGRGNRRRKSVEEVLREGGNVTNGRGRKGDSKKGYVVVGEYRRVKELGSESGQKGKGKVAGKKVGERSEGREVISTEEEGKSEKEKRERKLEYRKRNYERKLGRKVGRERVDRSEEVRKRGRRGEVSRRRGRERSALEVGRVVTVVLGGVRRMERLLGERVVRKREGSGRGHRKALREVEGRRKQHGKRSSNGRRRKVVKGKQGGYYGYRVSVEGTRNGGRRTTKTELGRGRVSRSRKRGRLGEWEGVAKTSVGTLGVRVGYRYSQG
jgi:hypothetical protein